MSEPTPDPFDERLLDADAWDAPDHLTLDELHDAAGADWRRAETLSAPDPEDEP